VRQAPIPLLHSFCLVVKAGNRVRFGSPSRTCPAVSETPGLSPSRCLESLQPSYIVVPTRRPEPPLKFHCSVKPLLDGTCVPPGSFPPPMTLLTAPKKASPPFLSTFPKSCTRFYPHCGPSLLQGLPPTNEVLSVGSRV